MGAVPVSATKSHVLFYIQKAYEKLSRHREKESTDFNNKTMEPSEIINPMTDQKEELMASKGQIVGDKRGETVDYDNISSLTEVENVKLIGFVDIQLPKVSRSSQVMITETIQNVPFVV